ncbi:hypothetical protein Trydic_g14047 [Trypoxylus dichotomus]
MDMKFDEYANRALHGFWTILILFVILAGDLNAKHPSWNSKVTNASGTCLRRFANDFHLLVDAAIEPTIFPHNEQPDVLDIVVMKNVAQFHQLTVLNELSSDHNRVLLQLGQMARENEELLPHRTVYWPAFTDHLSNNICPITAIDGPIQLETVVQVTKRKPKIRNKRFACRTLQIIHPQKNRLRRQRQRTLNPVLKAEYNQMARRTNEKLNVLYEKNWTRLVTEQLKRFEKVVVESGKAGNSSVVSDTHWTFGGALLYTLTLLTTIGYGRLSPKTALGKVIAMFYAIIGVPFMLILLSLMGSYLADVTRKGYLKLCCKKERAINSVVGYHKAPSSPPGKHSYRSGHDDCTIQILPHNSQNNFNLNCKQMHHLQHSDFHMDHVEMPKKALLATVRASHSRGRCRQGQVKQMLAESHFCLPYPHGTPSRSVPGSLTASDVEETEDTEDSEHGACVHDTPSRVPLIYRPPSETLSTLPQESVSSLPTVPAIIVLILFSTYVCAGATLFALTKGWNFLDAAYFCFIALATIGLSDVLPNTNDLATQLQLIACCTYLFVGLILVAMCFSLVQEEIANKCRQIAKNIGFSESTLTP